jgi:UDP-N-acetylmuramate: L-alanyl-gamma-D-glutamyl-meso-diaminopimelate ligase
VWVILEPRSNTMRRNVLQDALARSLALADQVIVAAIFKSEAIPLAQRLDLHAVIADIQKQGKPAEIFVDADAIVSAIAPKLRAGDVVAILSNGGFGNIYEKLPQRLRELGTKAGAASR